MLVSGLREVKDEVCRLVAQTFLKEAFDMKNVEIIRVHRIGGVNQQHRKNDYPLQKPW